MKKAKKSSVGRFLSVGNNLRLYMLVKTKLYFFSLAVLLSGCKSDEIVAPAIMQQEVYNTGSLNYLLFMPSNIQAQEQGKFPMILSLHGIGERGNDLPRLKRDGLAKRLDGDEAFPFVVISPQCPLSTEWYYDRTDTLLIKLLDAVIARYPIDTNRIYLTGYSMGGIGAWDLALRNPPRFAAVLPIAARAEGGFNICVLKEVPAWVFHGAKDDVVDLFKAESLVNALRNCGGNVQFTVYPAVGHDAWTRTYNNAEVYDWLLRQRR